MERNFCVLFGIDGVLMDAEPRYALIWKHLADKYDAEGSGVNEIIGETDIDRVVARYFSHLMDNEKQSLKNEFAERLEKMTNPDIKGINEFVSDLKEKSIKMGLVTNYDEAKLHEMYNTMDFMKILDYMDVAISAKDMAEEKPNIGGGYLLAAEKLGCKPEECIVFDASYQGIEAARHLGMKVIALALSHPESELKEKADRVISDFSDFNLNELNQCRIN